MNIPRLITATGIVLALVGSHALAQTTARWRGGDGNWTDANWSNGSGANGVPGSGQNIQLPNNTGTVSVTTDPGSFSSLSQIGGTLTIADTGALDLSELRIGDTDGGAGVVNVFGRLDVGGGLNLSYGTGAGGGIAQGELNIGGSARLSVAADLDTWWDGGARLSVSGPNAQIEVGGTFYLGPTATMTANISSNQFSTINALGGVNLGGGTLDVNFTDDYTPALWASWTLFDTPVRTGQITTTNLPDIGPGLQLAVNYTEGGSHGQIVTLDANNTLNLKIDPTTGAASIENPVAGGVPFDIDGYIIRSSSASLSESTFAGLGSGDWLPGLDPSQSNNLLSETNITGSTLVQTGNSLPIGQIFNPAGSEDLTFEFHVSGGQTLPGTVQFGAGPTTPLQAGDADQNLRFDQLDLVMVQIAAKYLTGQAATWGDGDWNGAPGGRPGNPPPGDGLFNQLDIISALTAGKYLTGPYAALAGPGSRGDGQTSIIHDANTGDLTVVGSLAGGGALGNMDLIYVPVPEPSTMLLALLGLLGLSQVSSRRAVEY